MMDTLKMLMDLAARLLSEGTEGTLNTLYGVPIGQYKVFFVQKCANGHLVRKADLAMFRLDFKYAAAYFFETEGEARDALRELEAATE